MISKIKLILFAKLVIAKNAEECANSMQYYIEEYVEKNTDIEQLARRAFLSYVRAYSTYPRDLKHIFHPKNLHMGHLAKSFGLRKSPNEIVDNEMKIKKTTRDSSTANFKKNTKSTSEFELQHTKR